jgi:aspartate aminotransferase
MADRIIEMRALLKKNLEDLGSKHDWSHITSQVSLSFSQQVLKIFPRQELTVALHRLACLPTLD